MLEILNREDKIKILKSRGFRVKTVTEQFPSRYGGDYHKKMVDYVVDPFDNFVVPSLDRVVDNDYYIDEAIKPIIKSKVMQILLAL